jgi:hypothetical protein
MRIYLIYSKYFNYILYLWLNSPLLDLGRFFSFLLLYTVGRIPWTGDQPVARPLPAHTEKHKHRINAYRHPRLEFGFEPTITVFQLAKTVLIIFTLYTFLILKYNCFKVRKLSCSRLANLPDNNLQPGCEARNNPAVLNSEVSVYAYP